ncbi:hypothetical protein N4P33_19375 [Streptomyces sp. 15-116A]|uniref:hypothetical protein n=1 Tax=Streptomyces sp. 15-116A TaxID=2259035 RepID=UPI0021B1C6F9|nr:hypothetical protein [Streptomyces sp. 15-116A]MCT7354295.1 hypothetical protein [Streptomyces sp. 15-116A]
MICDHTAPAPAPTRCAWAKHSGLSLTVTAGGLVVQATDDGSVRLGAARRGSAQLRRRAGAD